MVSVLNRGRGLTWLFFVILGFLIYSNTLEAPFVLDDVRNIAQNPHIHLTELSFKDITRAGFKSYCSNRPIANISFALNYYFHQNNVIGYHAVNIFIHILTATLLYFFLRATLSIASLRSRYEAPGSIAFFAALLWLVHPIQSQSVTYIVQRMNSMAAMFYVLSFLLYVKGRLVKEGQRSWPWFSGCAVAGILAIGSKEIAATLPFFMLLYEWYFFQDLGRGWLKQHLVYIVGTLILFGLLALVYLGTDPLQAILSGYKHRDFTLTHRVLTEFRVVMHYISVLLYAHPSRLNLDHDFPVSHSLLEPMSTLFSMVAIVGLIGLAMYLAKKQRLISFCILWFFGNLAIESSVIGLEIIFEHRVYLPSMVFFVPILVLAYSYVKQRWAIAGVVSVGVFLLCLWTYERNSVWRDPVTFWTDCVEKAEKKPRGYINLGHVLYQQGRLDEAIAHFSEALRIKPGHTEASYNLALTLHSQGKLDEAIAHYRELLGIKPEHAEAHNSLGVCLATQGKLGEAIRHYLEALRIKPEFATGHNNLGNALARQGKLDEAIRHYLEALRIKLDYAEAHYNLGNALVDQGKLDEAIRHYSEALRIKPEFARGHNNLGLALAEQRKLHEAIGHYLEALRIKPDYAAARYNLGCALQEAGKPHRRSRTTENP